VGAGNPRYAVEESLMQRCWRDRGAMAVEMG